MLRRFAGAAADEVAILCRPPRRPLDTAHQAEAVYRTFAEILAAHGASFRDVASEVLFVRAIRCELPLILDVRARVLADLSQSAGAPSPAFIEQAPLEGASLELTGWAVIPHQRDAWSVEDVRAAPSCVCEGCARSAARLVRLSAGPTLEPAAPRVPSKDGWPQTQTALFTTNIYGAGGDAFEQARNMFSAAERLLNQCGMGFRDVVRTWIHLRDIDRDYDALNQARREFFRHRGVEPRPASTGVQGVPLPDAHDFSMWLHAVRSSRPLDITVMSTPSLNEAWSYGVDFSRGLRLAEANKVTLHVSGTASIDESGRTIHAGNFALQVDRMLDNIASLLAEQGATFENLVCATTYLKNPSDAPVLRTKYRERGFGGFPCALVQAALCRPELLCETEAVAML